jgi:hypothetical protein
MRPFICTYNPRWFLSILIFPRAEAQCPFLEDEC